MQYSNLRKYCCIRHALIVALSLCTLQLFSQVFPVDSIMRNGRRTNRINFAYMSDGYLNTDLNVFITNTNTINNALFATSPFKEYQNYFNSFAIRVPSQEAGAKHPRTASDEAFVSQPLASPNNYFQSTFDYTGVHRLLYPQNNTRLYEVLAANLPDYDHGLVVVNSSYYGGSGGEFATASTAPSSSEIAIHEIGHSFAGLADEYWAGSGYAAEYPNMTSNNNPATIKWKNWLGLNDVGIYPHGSTTPQSNWYRPHENCKMRFLNTAFCSVCKERFIDRIHELVSMTDDFTPATTSFTLVNKDPVSFSVTTVNNSPKTITANWYVNNNLFVSDQSAINVPYSRFTTGANTIRVEVIDNTDSSKSYLPGVGYINRTTWTVTNPSTLPIVLRNFAGLINNKVSVLNWEVDNGEEVKSFELSKSKDGTNFSLLTTIVNEQNKNKYSFIDPALLTPFTYYRLKIILKDGSETYSAIIRLQHAFDNFVYKVYQNSELHRYHLTTTLPNDEKVSIQVTDAAGKLVMRKDFGKVSGQIDYNIDLAGKASGIYFLKININNSNYIVQLLAK